MHRLIAVATALGFAGFAMADEPASIIVLDASGSMWGQIDEINKITIAQDVCAGCLVQRRNR